MGGIQGDDGRKEKTKKAMMCGDFDSKETFKAEKLLRKHGFMVNTAPTSDGLLEVRCYEDGILIGEFTDLNDLKKFLEKE